MINFTIQQDGAKSQSGAVLSQICIFVCGLNLFLTFLLRDFLLKFTGDFVFKFEF